METIKQIDSLNRLWVELYRPHTIADCILPEYLKKQFSSIAKSDVLPHMTLIGGAGIGKTTVARALGDEMNASYIVINASKDRNIDTVRTDIENFASTMSFNGQRKLIIMDEADGMNLQTAQPALRGSIEHFQANCSFILTGNFETKILGPILSRCPVIRFQVPREERKAITVAFFKRVEEILKLEKIKYDRKVVAEVMQQYFPDFREVLGVLQQYSASGEIDAGILATVRDADLKTLVAALKVKDFSAMRQWVGTNVDQDPVRLFRRVYDSMYDFVEPSTIPAMVLVLAEYGYKSAFVADQEINTVACFTQVMGECEFK